MQKHDRPQEKRARTRILLCFVVALGGASYGQAQHSRILPAPRQIEYGPGSLPIGRLRVEVAATSSPDDRTAQAVLTSCISAALKSNQSTGEKTSTTIQLKRTGTGTDMPLPMPGDQVGPQSREAYTLVVASSGVTLSSSSSAGLYYGAQTLCQMIEMTPAPSLPFATVRDWPALAFRGTMVDMSEGPLLHVKEIKQQLDLMAQLKMNQYYFYNESTIALDGLPPASPGAGLSKSDVREVVAYARARHIDVVPCLELYGHLHDLFRREQYSDLADFPHGVEFDPTRPRTRQLLESWATQYMDLFPSSFVHVGFDETWQLRQAATAGAASPADYFTEQLRQVSDLFRKRGKTVMAWADIMVKYPQIIAKLPTDTIAVAWFYDPKPDPLYTRWIGPLAAAHLPFMVAPGVSAWNEIAPDNDLTFANIDTLVAAGRRSGALGMINTIWSDDLQMLKRPAAPGIAYGAAAAWQQEPPDRAHFFDDYAQLVAPRAAAAKLGSALRKMAESETALQEVLGQNTMVALWRSPFREKLLASAGTHQAALRRSRLLAEGAEDDLLAAEDAGADRASLQAYLVECRLLDYAGMKFQYAVEIQEAWKSLGSKPTAAQLENDFDNLVVAQQHGKVADLMEAITELKPQYREAWLGEYTTFRLGAALGRWDAEYEYWRALQANFQEFLEDYDPQHGLPSFSTLLPAR